MVFDENFSAVNNMREGTVSLILKNLVNYHLDISMQENFNLPKWWHTNESSSMPLTRKAWEQDPQEPGSQDPPPGPDPQNLTRGMTQYTASSHVTEKFPIPSIGEGTNDKGHINQVIHINSVQDLT